MSVSRNLLTVVMVGLLALWSCGGDSTGSSTAPTPAPGLSNGSMTAIVDGSSWSASGFLTVQYQPNVAPFVLIGSDALNSASARIVTISVPAYGTGTFTACLSIACVFLSLQANGNSWEAGPVAGSSGTISISTQTVHNAVGTFSFIGMGLNNTQKSVINGAFNVNY